MAAVTLSDPHESGARTKRQVTGRQPRGPHDLRWPRCRADVSPRARARTSHVDLALQRHPHDVHEVSDGRRARVTRVRGPTCRRCGAEVEAVRDDCGCRARLRSLSRLRSAALYEGPMELAVRRFKYDGWRRLAAPLAELIAERLVAEGL